MKFENDIFLKRYEHLTKQEINSLFITACVSGQIEHVKYLLTSSDLKIHADVHTENDLGFILATKNGLLEHSGHLVRKLIKETYVTDPNYEQVLKYLIIEQEIEKTDHIKAFLETLPNQNHYLFKMIEQLFLMIETKKYLEKQLKVNQSQNTLETKI